MRKKRILAGVVAFLLSAAFLWFSVTSPVPHVGERAAPTAEQVGAGRSAYRQLRDARGSKGGKTIALGPAQLDGLAAMASHGLRPDRLRLEIRGQLLTIAGSHRLPLGRWLNVTLVAQGPSADSRERGLALAPGRCRRCSAGGRSSLAAGWCILGAPTSPASIRQCGIFRSGTAVFPPSSTCPASRVLSTRWRESSRCRSIAPKWSASIARWPNASDVSPAAILPSTFAARSRSILPVRTPKAPTRRPSSRSACCWLTTVSRISRSRPATRSSAAGFRPSPHPLQPNRLDRSIGLCRPRSPPGPGSNLARRSASGRSWPTASPVNRASRLAIRAAFRWPTLPPTAPASASR